jgi:hypothetical protein
MLTARSIHNNKAKETAGGHSGNKQNKNSVVIYYNFFMFNKAVRIITIVP